MSSSDAFAANELLRRFPRAVSRILYSSLSVVLLRQGDVLSDASSGASNVYFPSKGMVSVQTSAEGRLQIEMVGREGMVGLPRVFSVRAPPSRIVAQGNGSGLRMTASALRRRKLIRYARGRISLLALDRLQAVSCGCNLRKKQIRDSVLWPRR